MSLILIVRGLFKFLVWVIVMSTNNLITANGKGKWWETLKNIPERVCILCSNKDCIPLFLANILALFWSSFWVTVTMIKWRLLVWTWHLRRMPRLRLESFSVTSAGGSRFHTHTYTGILNTLYPREFQSPSHIPLRWEWNPTLWKYTWNNWKIPLKWQKEDLKTPSLSLKNGTKWTNHNPMSPCELWGHLVNYSVSKGMH